ncbi:hypothetical protein HMPREF9080_02215 [Cardiobacterium valvarum F0432]|uniref:Uncharacterized protein n=1 Tax=Cardiobacterium valvarum F0432 TaxID=797473 RepID=G9ZHI6_9GAMM|nr:hypothetical protein HMPREF9080_02215 [Cardiobacterium valvarum F0432]
MLFAWCFPFLGEGWEPGTRGLPAPGRAALWLCRVLVPTAFTYGTGEAEAFGACAVDKDRHHWRWSGLVAVCHKPSVYPAWRRALYLSRLAAFI